MAFASYTHIISWLEPRSVLLFPLLCALLMAGNDVKSRRIPNYLTLTTALSGLALRGACYGISGLTEGFLGLLLGFGLLFLPYYLGGMGAGDVKALAALGAWLGPKPTFFLFYMAEPVQSGWAYLWWRGLLWQKLRQGKVYVVNLILSRHFEASPQAARAQNTEGQGIPYGVAIATGMLAVFWIGN